MHHRPHLLSIIKVSETVEAAAERLRASAHLNPSDSRGSWGLLDLLDPFCQQMGAPVVCSVCSEDSPVRARPACYQPEAGCLKHHPEVKQLLTLFNCHLCCLW